MNNENYFYWTERKAAQKDKKDHNRRYSRDTLERMGYKLTDLPSKRVLIEHGGKTIYFVLGTGSWACIEPTRTNGRGLHNLIHFTRCDEVIEREHHERIV